MVIMRPPPPPPPPLKISTKISPDLIKKEEPTSSIPDLEFDGMTVLCRVCGDKASGFHYGVHSCEGCKGFFRRSIQQKIQYRPCTKNQQCSILRINRNRCQYCRLKKCIVVGMSRDAVRFGRVPKREKARILAAMQQSSNSRFLEKAFCAELEDEQRLLSTIVRAHLDTCDFTKIKIEPMLMQAREDPSYTVCPPTLACPLNPNPQPLTGQQELLQDFSKRFSPAIRGVVEFAKLIPGFSLLAQDDQVTLLKAGVFEVLLVRLACLFDSETNSMVCLNGQVLKRESIQNSANARFLIDSMFDFAERINAMNLTDVEIALFCAIVVIAMDRPGLRHADLIEKMHSKLKHLLLMILKQNRLEEHVSDDVYNELIRKIPDLRTLNTLHSEKLLAFKMTEQQQQQQQQQQQIWPKTNNKMACSNNGYNWQGEHVEEVKSPMGSVSSTESYSGDLIENAPLLAASLSGNPNLYQHRVRSNSGSGSTSSSGDDDIMGNTTHLIQNGLTITPVIRKAVVNNNVSSTNHNHNATTITTNNANVANTATVFRKIDSPSDSGIESGTEKFEKTPINGTSSTNTSLCSSPRSSLEDHSETIILSKCHHQHQHHHHHHHQQHENHQHNHNQQHIDDMPVLKRVLQAPPLYDTNSLMDEAYKPHKKFRALRTLTPATSPVIVKKEIVEADTIVLESVEQQQKSSLSKTHSTLAKSLMESPKLTPEQRKRTDIIHEYLMQGDFLASCPFNKKQPSSNCSSSSSQQHIKSEQPQSQPQSQQTNVIMNGRTYSPALISTTSSSCSTLKKSVSPIPTSQSPHSTSSSTSLSSILAPQPLNLSKKSPSPSPPSTAVSIEA